MKTRIVFKCTTVPCLWLLSGGNRTFSKVQRFLSKMIWLYGGSVKNMSPNTQRTFFPSKQFEIHESQQSSLIYGNVLLTITFSKTTEANWPFKW